MTPKQQGIRRYLHTNFVHETMLLSIDFHLQPEITAVSNTVSEGIRDWDYYHRRPTIQFVVPSGWET